MIITPNKSRFPFTPFPDGIYAVAFSHELKTNQVKSIIFMGEKLALFRTHTGNVGAINAYCPHLGADLTFGTVKNDALQCPFHGLNFKRDGTCSAKNHLGQVGSYHIKQCFAFEQYGLIFLTYNPLGNDLKLNFPSWVLSEWGTPIQHCFKIRSHPQEILENSVDQLHFFQVHKYIGVKASEPLQTKGTEFTIRYHLERKKGLFGFDKNKIEFFLDIHAFGLGMSKVEIILPKYNLEAKQIVFPTPIDGEFIHVRTLTSIKIPEKILL